MKKFGLIGYPLSHSFSKKYFTEKFTNENIPDCVYELYPIKKIDQVGNILQSNPELVGLNVTIPYKEEVISYLGELDETAKAVGAVNTIKISNGNSKGYNTDVYGFRESLKPLLKPHHKRALILGTGGASKAVAYCLRQLNIDYIFVSRTQQQGCVSYDSVRYYLHTFYVVINTTPLGMSPDTDQCPTIAYDAFSEKHLCYDLVYNPEETLFLKKAKEQGATVKNGLEMLYLQAERAWEIWNQ